jgi:hypothetical protein
MYQFANNLKKFKNIIGKWTKQRSQNAQKEIIEIGEQIKLLFKIIKGCIFSGEEKIKLKY